MTDQNPYAAPAPIPEESSENSTPEPRLLRGAAWQGVKVGFKGGSIIAFGVIGLGLGAFAIEWVMAVTRSSRPVFDGSWLLAIASFLGMYFFCTVLGIIVGVIISSLEHLLRKGIAATQRARGDKDG